MNQNLDQLRNNRLESIETLNELKRKVIDSIKTAHISDNSSLQEMIAIIQNYLNFEMHTQGILDKLDSMEYHLLKRINVR